MNNEYTKYIKKIKYEDEFNDSFETLHTRIDNTHIVVDYGSLEDLFLGISIKNVGSKFYEDESCFESINALGELLKNDEQKLKGDALLIEEVKHISKWLEYNPYPYKSKSIYPNFTYDCIQLYSIFEAHKWLIKARRNIITIANSFSKTKTDNPELNNLIYHLDYLKNNTMNFGERINYVLDSPKYEKYNELLSQGIIDFTKNRSSNESILFDKTKLEEFINQTALYLIDYVETKINVSKEEFYITTQKTNYIFDTMQNKIRYANSIVGIAYDRLLLNLTAYDTQKKEICCVRDCENTFDKTKSDHHWCPIHQNARKNANRNKNKDRNKKMEKQN